MGEPGTTGIPNRKGFDYFYGYLNQGHAHNYYPEYLWRNEEQVPLEGNMEGRKEQYSHDLCADESIAFVERHKNEPFFLYLAFQIPHAHSALARETGNGMEVPDDAPYSDKPWSAPHRGLAAMITRMDRDIGRLFDRLRELGIDENTLVIFSSDNGPHRAGGNDPEFFNSSGPLRGIKRDLYEGGIRVPCIARWPGRIAPGSVIDYVGAFWDFLPTAAELAGASIPDGIDGLSIVPALLGDAPPAHHYLYWEFHERGFCQAVRIGDWKAVRLGMDGPVELYNLAEDLGETRDVAADHLGNVARARTVCRSPVGVRTLAHRARPPGTRIEEAQTIMHRRSFLKASGAGAFTMLWGSSSGAAREERPNIVWIVVEDMSCHFSYQGETTIRTPHVDRLAREGVVFDSAYITCPVCSPARSAMITGMYQTTIGAHNHRSFRGAIGHDLPAPVRTLPEYFKDAGYYVCNGANVAADQPGKTDYNFNHPKDLYDGPNPSGRRPGQPFFMQYQLRGGKYRNAEMPNPVSPKAVTLPPYYPDDPVMREDWARYLNSVLYVDREVGEIMARLKADGDAENTVVIFMTDHGISHARGKQFVYEEGVHIPFIVWAPGRVPGGAVRGDLVAHIDMAATSMHFANIPIPSYMESRPLFGPNARPRDYVVSARDRCDETVDRLRSVRKGRFTYIRNFYPNRPHMQPNAYKDSKEIVIRLRELYAEGKLAGHPAERLFTVPRPEEELYDRHADPWELTNLAEDPAHAQRLTELRRILDTWIRDTGDHGQTPETEAVYDSDMAVYLESRKDEPEYIQTMQRNIAQMKAWAREGK